MKRKNELRIRLRAAGFGLLGAAAVLLAGCDGEEFVRDGGEMPLPTEGTPVGALYAKGYYNTEIQNYAISSDKTVSVVYRIDYPADEDVTVTLAIGTQEDIDAYNDAKGLEDDHGNLGGFKRYRLLPATNYTLPGSLTLTVPKGQTESAPLSIDVVYNPTLLPGTDNRRMIYPWMLPLQVESIQGDILPLVADQQLGIGILPGNLASMTNAWFAECEWKPIAEKRNPFMGIAFADCRVVDPSYVIYYGFQESQYVDMGGWVMEDESTISCYPLFEVECLRPLFITQDDITQNATLQTDPDLMYVLTHQGRYVDPQRKQQIKMCVSVEIAPKSVCGLCNLSEENQSSLAWQIANFVEKYGLDGVALNDKGANYTAEDAPAVDKSSYTKFLKALREAMGDDKLILLSYDADENSALYEAHDGLQAGDYIDYAWWGTENEICTPYDPESTVRPIAGLDKSRFIPMAGNAVDTPEFDTFWNDVNMSGFYQMCDLYDRGECPGLVYLGLVARTQNFAEYSQATIPMCMGMVPLHESDMTTKPGWFSIGFMTQETMEPVWGSGAYGAGLKDW